MSLLTHRGFRWLSLLAICSALFQGGLTRAIAFNSAMAEMHRFGLELAAAFTAISIAFELGASLFIVTRLYCWARALLLALFALAATLLANRFWSVAESGHLMVENIFLEHLGLVVGLLLAAWFDLKERLERRAQSAATAFI